MNICNINTNVNKIIQIFKLGNQMKHLEITKNENLNSTLIIILKQKLIQNYKTYNKIVKKKKKKIQLKWKIKI